MSVVIVSEKGQVTIPQELRRKLKLSKGDTLIVDMAPDGGILLRPAAVFPIEIYSEKRLKEFEKEDAMTPAEHQRLKKTLGG